MSKQYQYKLNENAVNSNKEPIESMQLCELPLKNNAWLSHHSRLNTLDPYIRTKNNTAGILDYREFRTEDESVVYDSKDAFNEVPDRIYSFEELSLLERIDLVKIARVYNIPLSGKTNRRLMKEILDMQNNILVKSKPSDEL